MSEITIPDPDNLILTGLELLSPAQVNRSQWTGARKVIGMPGAALWTGSASIDLISTEVEERKWRAFLFGLRGPQNWFRWPLPWNQHIGPMPTVDTSASNGYTLPLTGMQPGTRILLAGQFMTVPLPSGRYRAVCLTADLISDATGEGVATFVPALTETPTLAAIVETARPFVPMSPVAARQGFVTEQGVSGTSFDVEEAR